MLEQKILDQKPITLNEIKEMLKERAKSGELTYEQNLTLKYVSKFSKLTKSKNQKILKEMHIIEGMTPDLAVKIVDILPDSIEVLELLIPKNSAIKKEQLQPILDTVKKYTADSEKKK